MTFYNTIQENPNQLAKSESKAKTQEANIINCFKQYERPLSPSMVLSMTGLKCPLTSIRRAMTNLSNEGKLIKTDVKMEGMYGKQEHLWCLPKKQESFSQSTLPF